MRDSGNKSSNQHYLMRQVYFQKQTRVSSSDDYLKELNVGKSLIFSFIINTNLLKSILLMLQPQNIFYFNSITVLC